MSLRAEHLDPVDRVGSGTGGRSPGDGPSTTPQRQPHRHRRWTLVGFGLVVVGALWLLLVFAAFPGTEAWAYDYRAYAEAAERLVETGSLYQAETLDGPYRPGPFGLYMYAPPLGTAMVPLTGLEADTAIAIWFLLRVLALAVACALLPVQAWVRLAIFSVAAFSFAVMHDLILGNVSTLLLLPLAAAWRWLDRPAGSIAQALAISVRPMLGILIIWQLLRRKWRAVLWTIAAGLVLILLTLPFVGLSGYLDYLTMLRNLSGVTGVEFNYDLSSVVVGLGLDESAAGLVLLAGYALAIVAIVLSLRRDRELGFIVTVSASLLLSPLLWDHYLAMLVLPAAFLASRGHPWALLLPLGSWLPGPALPFVAVAATWLPFLTCDPATPVATTTSIEPGPGT